MKQKLAAGAVIFFLLIQLVPYGRDHTNPTVAGEPVWDSPQTADLFYRACGDCHSHQTVWPWYSNVAPVSWLVQRDVDEGREHFNVSQWGFQDKNEGEEAAKELREGEMPPWFYLPLHAHARLTDNEKADLIRGLIATFGEGEDHEEGDEDH